MRALISSLLLVALLPAVGQTTVRNESYALDVAESGVVTVTTAGMPPQVLNPEFTVLSSATDPKMTRIMTHPNYVTSPRIAVRWSGKNDSVDSLNEWLSSADFKSASGSTGIVTEEDGQRVWQFTGPDGKPSVQVKGIRAIETSRPFKVAQVTKLTASSVAVNGNVIKWQFAAQPGFAFAAQVTLPPGKADPEIRYTITPSQAAYFSVAYTGVPEIPLSRTLSIPQETDSRSHKLFNYVVSEPDLHLPRVQIATKDGNVAITADPAECRFRLPLITDARFGVMLQEDGGQLRPVLFSPLLGGPESKMAAGKPWSFTIRYVQLAGDWKDAYVHIARDIHGFRDQRDNSGAGSLNDTIARVIDYLDDARGKNYAMWDTQQKYYDYFTDKTGIFKPFSPLYGLSAAIVTDDEKFFRDRGLPAAEFAISRRNSVFAPYDNSDNKQANSAVRTVGEPYLGYAQTMSLYDLLQRRTPALRALAEKGGMEKNSVSDALARWQYNSDAAALAEARSAAAKLSPRTEGAFFDLLDVADATKDPADINAAVNAAYSVAAMTLNFYPVPPDENVTVDVGGKGPIHKHSFSRHSNIWGYPEPVPIPAPEQTVPAWRIARLGVPSPAYPMEYWMNTHGAILRAAGLGRDSFLRDTAHWGVVGRFGNYPGDNRMYDSLVAELPDAVEAPPWKWNFATVNPGHAWDFISEMIDFLVSDGYERSKAAIDFPAVRAAGSAFRTRIYGSAPGKFYDDSGVYLWIPRGLVKTDNRQIDWLGGHGNGNLYVALWNQSYKEETVSVTIDSALAECDSAKDARVWKDNAAASPIRVEGNKLTITLSPKGITAFAIPAVTKPRLQAKLYAKDVPALGPNSFTKVDASYGPVHAMLIRAGAGLNSAFVYTEALPENVISARLRWKQGNGEWQELTDNIYPYEFSPNLSDDGGDFVCVLDIEDSHQKVVSSPVIALSPGEAPPAVATAPVAGPFPALPPLPAPDAVANPPLSDEFVAYIQKAANPDNYGLRKGRYYPYSTPQGRRIGWKQAVWTKDLYANGCTPQEAEQHLRSDLARAQDYVIKLLAARSPAVEYSKLDRRQQETLLDLAYTEGKLSPEIVETVVAGNWDRFVSEVLYARYGGHAPDHVRNKAFFVRWDIK